MSLSALPWCLLCLSKSQLTQKFLWWARVTLCSTCRLIWCARLWPTQMKALTRSLMELTQSRLRERSILPSWKTMSWFSALKEVWWLPFQPRLLTLSRCTSMTAWVTRSTSFEKLLQSRCNKVSQSRRLKLNLIATGLATPLTTKFLSRLQCLYWRDSSCKFLCLKTLSLLEQQTLFVLENLPSSQTSSANWTVTEWRWNLWHSGLLVSTPTFRSRLDPWSIQGLLSLPSLTSWASGLTPGTKSLRS